MTKVTGIRMAEQTRAQIEELREAGFGTITGIVQVAIDRMYQQEIGSHLKEKTMNSNTINKNSARAVAYQLFSGRSGQVDFYADPETGNLEALLAGEIPTEGYEYIRTENEGQIEIGQELCETPEELEALFESWWRDAGQDWLSELEEAWEEA